MGAKAWFVAYFDDDPKTALSTLPEFDRRLSLKLATRLFPVPTLKACDDGELAYLNPDENEISVGCYPGVTIVAHEELASDFPSSIDERWLNPSLGRNVYLHAIHSAVDWFAYGYWRDGRLIRSLGLSPDSGVQENIGDPQAFELPYWGGRFPVDDDGAEDTYPFPFHPLDLAEASLLHHLGFQFEGYPQKWVCDPIDMRIARYAMEWPAFEREF